MVNVPMVQYIYIFPRQSFCEVSPAVVPFFLIGYVDEIVSHYAFRGLFSLVIHSSLPPPSSLPSTIKSGSRTCRGRIRGAA